MANYQNLKAAISAAIRTNGNQEITGQVLQDVLNSIVSVIGANYTFAGVATPATNPGTPDQNVIYLAMEGGTYTNFNGTVLPAGISLLMWNGSWTSETVMYGDGGVFDISVYKSSGGTLATFADLSAALDGGNNIPASARKGGMSVKFVQSSDNKYVQWRCIADEFTTDTTQWVISDEGILIEDSEFLEVRLDPLKRIIYAVKSDGTIYFGAGVPPQIVEYVQNKIAELSLDEYEDIVTFLNGIEEGDKTFQQLLNEKVDKEEGKSLISMDVSNRLFFDEIPEFLDLKVDSKNRIIAAVTSDKYIINLPLYFASCPAFDELKQKVDSNTDVNKTVQKFTMLGSPDNENYYYGLANVILKAGVHYKIEFTSNSFSYDGVHYTNIWVEYIDPQYRGDTTQTILSKRSGDVPSTIEDFCPEHDMFIYYWSFLTKGSYLDVTFTETSDTSSIEYIDENQTNIDSVRKLINAQKAENLFTGDVVTPAQYKLAIASGFDIDADTGNMYIGGGMDVAYGESGWDDATSKTALIVHNILSKETEILPVVTVGETIGSYTVTSKPNEFVVPMINGDDEVTCLLRNVGVTNQGVASTINCVARKFTPSTKQFDDELLICDIDVNGTTYDFQDLAALRTATDCEYYTFTNTPSFYFSMGPVSINGEFYMVMMIGYYSHILVKSSDMVHWTFVSDIPIGSPSEELDLCFMNDRIYATSRGNKGRFSTQESYQGYSTVIYYDMTMQQWSEPVVLTGYSFERPTIFNFNDKIYCIQGTGKVVAINGKNIQRLQKNCLVFDNNLNLLRVDELSSNYINLHPLAKTYGCSVYAVTSTDMRGLSYFKDGDGRAELTVSRLNMDLWNV